MDITRQIGEGSSQPQSSQQCSQCSWRCSLERVVKDLVEGPLDKWAKVAAKVSMMQAGSAGRLHRIHVELIHPAIQTLDYMVLLLMSANTIELVE